MGSQLWLSLSGKLGCQVTKKNLRSILTHFAQLESSTIAQPAPPDDVSQKLEFPGSPLRFGSPIYIERSPIENLAIATIRQAGSLIRLKAPQGTGKTSLINHLMGVAHNMGMQTVFVDVQQADTLRFWCHDCSRCGFNFET